MTAVEQAFREQWGAVLASLVGHLRDFEMAEEATQEAFAIIDSLRLDGFHYMHAARAELLHRLGRDPEARAACERALTLVHDAAERRLLQRRLAGLGPTSRSPSSGVMREGPSGPPSHHTRS